MEHPLVAQDPATTPGKDVLSAEHAAAEPCFATPCSAAPSPAELAETPETAPSGCEMSSCHKAMPITPCFATPCPTVLEGTSATPPSCCETVCCCYKMPACRGTAPTTGCCDIVPAITSWQAPGYCQVPSAAEPCSVTLLDCVSSVTTPRGAQLPQKQGSLQMFQLCL